MKNIKGFAFPVRCYIYTLLLLVIHLFPARAQDPVTVASFTTTNPTTGLCAPAPVEFQIGNWFNNSPGTSYIIDFGDGSPDITLLHPLNLTNTIYLLTHTYTRSSCPAIDFKATLKVINGSRVTNYTLDGILVRQKPVADFGVPATCTGIPACFTNQAQNSYPDNSCRIAGDYTWDFGDGTTSNAINPPCHTYTSPGIYTVTLSVSNTACGSDIRTKQITVKPLSPPPVVANPPEYCQEQSAFPLTATGTGLLWYTTATGGTGSAIAPVPLTTTAGTK
ncbi:MAG TPA: PKD domain-containing protein, partial [Chitinophagaceae bacterium]|nr:PKD domain-containing protein [Chitinophagaceae bacterium]